MIRRFPWSLAALVPALVLVPIACGGSDDPPPANPASLTGGLCAAGCRAPMVCDTTMGCVECTSDEACPTAKPRCVRGTCSVCATNNDCPASIHSCSPTDNTCKVACGPGSAVTCDKSTQCDPKSGACAVCIADADCAGTDRPLCDPERKICVACVSNGNCGSRAPICTRRLGLCVQCVTNGDCPSTAPTCTPELKCNGGCMADADCPTNAPHCTNGSCTP